MKRILAIILTVLMLVSALPLTALAATYEVDSGITAQTSTAFYELKDFDNVCTEEEFRELLSQYKPSFSKENSFYGETLDPKGYYYTYLSSSFERAVYNGCYNITSTNSTYEIAVDDLNGYTIDTTSLENATDKLVNKVWIGMWSYRFDNVYDCDSFTNQTSIAKINYSYNTSTGVVTKTYITLKMTNHSAYSAAEITKRNQRIAQIAQIANQQITTYGKLKAIYDEIIKNAEYDYSDEALKPGYEDTRIFYMAHNSLGVLINQKGVCESYAKAFKLVCDYMGIGPCIVLTSSSHMWNVIYINGKWYGVDATWDDPGSGDGVWYDYFLCIDPDIVDGERTSHVPDGIYTIAPDYSDTPYVSCGASHTKVTVPGTPATCTSTGITDMEYCSICGEIITPATTIPKKAHTLSYVSAVPATYYSAGNIAHYKCTVCSNLFLDAEGKNQTSAASVIIPQLTISCDHVSCTDVPATPATTTSSGLTAGKVCDLCGAEVVVQQIVPQIDTIAVAKTSYAYTGKAIKAGVTVTDITGATIPSSNYTLSYSSGLKLPGTYTITVKFKGNYSGTHKLTYKIIVNKPAPKASTTTSSFKVSWSKVSGATGYVVYDANKKTVKDVKTATSYTISKRKAGTTYSYYVRTYKTISGKKYYSDYVKVTSSTLPATPKLSASSNVSTIKVSWGKVTGASGYVVYNSSKAVIKDCGNVTSLSQTELKSGTSYSFYVRAYRIVSGKRYYSAYAKVSYSTKPANPAVTASTSTSTVKLSWGKVTGASGYIVYDANKKKLSDRKTATSYSISSRKAGTTYTYYVRAYRKALSKTFYSDYVKITSTTLPATPSLKASSNAITIKLTWGKVTGASGYEIYNSSKQCITGLLSGNMLSSEIIVNKPGTSYTFYVRAYKTLSGKKYYSGYAKVTYATKPSFNESSVTVAVGKTYKLSLNTTASTVTWATSDKSIATVSSKGVVTGKKKGTATITATANGQKATIKVNVTTVTFGLNKTSFTIEPYYSHTLKAETNISGATINWSSSNAAVAKVDETGKVTGLTEGSAVITASMTYGGVTYKATCTVTVTIPTYSQYGFSEVPDFTAAVGSNIEPEYEDSVYGDETELRYDYYDINWDGEYSLSLDIYRNYLAAKGFEYERTYTDDNGYYSYSVEVYQNDAAGIFVELVLWENDDVSICIYKYKITLNKTSINIQPGFQTTISAETNISSGTIWWVSSNSRVASVEIEDNIVNIVAQKDGIAIITAYFERGGKRYSASCQVTVKTPTYVDYGYAEVPDFAGAVGNNIEPGEIYERTDETEFLYRYSDINWDGRYDDAIELYYDYLSVKGFAYVTTTTGTRDEWTYQAEYYQNTVARIRMIFVRWSDGDISIVMWRY